MTIVMALPYDSISYITLHFIQPYYSGVNAYNIKYMS